MNYIIAFKFSKYELNSNGKERRKIQYLIYPQNYLVGSKYFIKLFPLHHSFFEFVLVFRFDKVSDVNPRQMDIFGGEFPVTNNADEVDDDFQV